MAHVSRFQDLIAWQKARVLTGRIYHCTRDAVFSKDFGLSNQIQRAAVSVMANIAEGFERDGRAEFFQFLSIARSSCAEVKSHLFVAVDAGYLSEDECINLICLADEVSRIVGALRQAVKRQRDGV